MRRLLRQGDVVVARPCVVTVTLADEKVPICVGVCRTCYGDHIIDRKKYEAGEGPWRPYRDDSGDQFEVVTASDGMPMIRMKEAAGE